jgi:hypothetical protein
MIVVGVRTLLSSQGVATGALASRRDDRERTHWPCPPETRPHPMLKTAIKFRSGRVTMSSALDLRCPVADIAFRVGASRSLHPTRQSSYDDHEGNEQVGAPLPAGSPPEGRTMASTDYFFLGTLIGLISTLSIGVARSWLVACCEEPRCPWQPEGQFRAWVGSSLYRIPWRGRYRPSLGTIQPRRRAKRSRSLALVMEMPRLFANSREVWTPPATAFTTSAKYGGSSAMLVRAARSRGGLTPAVG